MGISGCNRIVAFAGVISPVSREAAECLKPTGEVVGCQDVGEVCSQLVVSLVVEALDRRVLDCAVHPLNLTIGQRVVGLGQSVLDPVRLADHVEAHGPGVGGIPIAGLLGELDTVVS